MCDILWRHDTLQWGYIKTTFPSNSSYGGKRFHEIGARTVFYSCSFVRVVSGPVPLYTVIPEQYMYQISGPVPLYTVIPEQYMYQISGPVPHCTVIS